MGVDVSAVTMIGVRFESVDEAEEFINTHYDAGNEFDVGDFESITGGLEWAMISAYSDSGGVIGIQIIEEELDEQGAGVRAAWKQARSLFPDSVQDKITPHSWAQYW